MSTTVGAATRHAVKHLQSRVAVSGLVRQFREKSNRRRALSPFFGTRPARYTETEVEGRLLVSREHRYVFSRIPKAGNAPVVAGLMVNDGQDAGNVEAVERFETTAPRLSDLRAAEVDEAVAGFFTFTLVRDPYSRLLSAYLDKVLRNKREAVPVRDFLGHHGPGPVPFGKFLDYLEFGEGWRDDAHWARQSDLMGRPAADMDDIGRFETITEDLPRIMRRIFGAEAEMPRLSRQATMATDLVGAQSAETLKRIHRIYEVDFDTLGYPRAVA